MMAFVAETSDRQLIEAFPQERHPLPAGGQRLAPGSSSSGALGLAIGLNSSLEHCDPADIHTISNTGASNTRQIYASHWKIFSACFKGPGA